MYEKKRIDKILKHHFSEREFANNSIEVIKKNYDFFIKLWKFSEEIINSFKTLSSKEETHEEYWKIQLMYLAKIMDNCRCILHLSSMGYGEQAGMLGASLWEQAQTMVYFYFNKENPKVIEAFHDANKGVGKMPNILKDRSFGWKDMSDENIKENSKRRLKLEGEEGLENLIKKDQKQAYEVYKKLCKIKHSFPDPYVNRVYINSDSNTVSLVYGAKEPISDMKDLFGMGAFFDWFICALEIFLISPNLEDHIIKSYNSLCSEWEETYNSN